MKHLVLDIGGVFYRGWPDEAFWERWSARTGLDRETMEAVLSKSPEHRAAQVGKMTADAAFAAAGARLGIEGRVMRALAEDGYTGYVGHEFVPKAPSLQALKQAYDLCNV